MFIQRKQASNSCCVHFAVRHAPHLPSSDVMSLLAIMAPHDLYSAIVVDSPINQVEFYVLVLECLLFRGSTAVSYRYGDFFFTGNQHAKPKKKGRDQQFQWNLT